LDIKYGIVHQGPQLDPTLTQINPVDILTSYFFKDVQEILKNGTDEIKIV
jgi:hypothetical protein